MSRNDIMTRRIAFARVCLGVAVLCTAGWATAATQYVIAISVDGLGSSYLQALIDSNEAPNFR